MNEPKTPTNSNRKRHTDVVVRSRENSSSDEDNLSVEYSRTPSSNTKKAVKILSNITVEPAIIGTMFIVTLYSMLAKEYIYERLALDHNLTNTNRHKSCNETTANKSDPEYILQQKVSAETSNWMMYTLTSTFLFAIFSTILLGSWSDKVGRKTPMLISLFGIFVLMVNYVIVINFNFPVAALLVGHVITGLCGDVGTILSCAFSYIADIAERSSRTFRMTVTEMCLGLGGFVAAISGAEWVKAQGYRNPYWFLLALSVFNFIYILFRLPSTHEGRFSDNMRHLFTREPFVHMYGILKAQEEDQKRHISLLLYCICFFIIALSFVGIRDILVIYEIGLPFCWNAVLVGISLALFQIAYFVSLILIKVFSSISSEMKLIIISAISTALSFSVLAFASSSWMIFLGLFFQLCSNLPFPIIRSQASRLVSQNEVGSILALLACAQNIGSLVASLLFTAVFSATVESALPGTAFLIGTALNIVFLPLYWFAYQRSKASLSQESQYEYVTNDEER